MTSKEPFDAVVERHGPMVLRICRALHGPDAAADVWSETFLSALRGYDELPEHSNVAAWLVTIAQRRAVDEHRRRARHAAAVPQVDGIAPSDEPMVPFDLGDPLMAAVADLPARQRAAVVLRYLGDLGYDEIAELVRCSPAAARRAAADGIAALRARRPDWEER